MNKITKSLASEIVTASAKELSGLLGIPRISDRDRSIDYQFDRVINFGGKRLLDMAGFEDVRLISGRVHFSTNPAMFLEGQPARGGRFNAPDTYLRVGDEIVDFNADSYRIQPAPDYVWSKSTTTTAGDVIGRAGLFFRFADDALATLALRLWEAGTDDPAIDATIGAIWDRLRPQPKLRVVS